MSSVEACGFISEFLNEFFIKISIFNIINQWIFRESSVDLKELAVEELVNECRRRWEDQFNLKMMKH